MVSKITEAVVYLQGAQITRKQTFSATSEINKFVFGKLPSNINIESITVEADENAVVLSVQHGYVTIPVKEENPGRVGELNNKIKELQDMLKIEQSMLEVCQEEENLLREKCSETDGKVYKFEEMKDTIIFFKKKLTEISREKIELEEKIMNLHTQINLIYSEIGNAGRTRSEEQVEVEIYCEKDCETELTLSYFTSNANWTPYYDIRAKDVEKPVSIYFKGMVYQSTGEDWENVNLTLSTGNPSLSGIVPELTPWYIDFDRPAVASSYQQFNAIPVRMEKKIMCTAMMEAKECEKVDEIHMPVKQMVVATESLTSAEYTLATPYTVKTSGNGKSVDIKTHELETEYIYYSVRKLEKDVFLMANLKGWEHLNLLQGNANIFFEGKYVGKSVINPRQADEILGISLGRDKGVMVTRVKGKDFSGKTLIGSNNKISREWELTARNLKKQAIKLILEDQIPVSINKSITVDTITISDAEHNKDTGKLKWEFTLEPAASKKLSVKYSVTYPKNSSLTVD